jgi:hypothetical protein
LILLAAAPALVLPWKIVPARHEQAARQPAPAGQPDFCPLCNERRAKRFCPAKGEIICAICCGREREVTIDCPSDCAYLIAARRYEEEHRKPLGPEELPYPDVELKRGTVEDRRALVTHLAASLVEFARKNHSLTDREALEALAALAETYRTLTAGIYYEKPPAAVLPRALYEHLSQAIQQFKKEEAERAGFPTLKDSAAFHLLVFLLRLGRHRTNGRRLTRGFLDYLRAHFPEAQPAASRIVTW